MKSSIVNTQVYLTVTVCLFLCGFLHVALYRVCLADGFSQFFCGVCVTMWMLTVQRRITDASLRRLMYALSAALLVLFLLQLCRYDLLTDAEPYDHLLWYAFYVPNCALPVICWMIALRIMRRNDRKHTVLVVAVLICALLLCALILTNDFHRLAFRFPDDVHTDSPLMRRGPVYFLFLAFTVAALGMSYGLILFKYFRHVSRRLHLSPVIPIVLGGAYHILYFFRLDPRIGGIPLWNYEEVYAWTLIACLEACIVNGMIPANTGYEKLFAMTEVPAAITNAAGKLVYQTAAAELPFRDTDDQRIRRYSISGGTITWVEDLSEVRDLNRRLEEVSEQMEARNSVLAAEGQIRRERAEVETRNRLYDRISEGVRGQLEKTEALFEDGSDAALARIAGLTAYVKRRSNLELAVSDGTLRAEDLAAALAESLDYLKLCGVGTSLVSFTEGPYPAGQIISLYEQFELVAESNPTDLNSLNAVLRSENGRLSLRLRISSDGFTFHPKERFRGTVSMDRDGEDLLLTMTCAEGGDGV